MPDREKWVSHLLPCAPEAVVANPAGVADGLSHRALPSVVSRGGDEIGDDIEVLRRLKAKKRKASYTLGMNPNGHRPWW